MPGVVIIPTPIIEIFETFLSVVAMIKSSFSKGRKYYKVAGAMVIFDST